MAMTILGGNEEVVDGDVGDAEDGKGVGDGGSRPLSRVSTTASDDGEDTGVSVLEDSLPSDWTAGSEST